MKRRYKYRLPLSEDAEGGMGSVLMASFSGLFLIVSAVISFVFAGKAGIYVGIFGLMGILLAAAGFITGLISFGEKKKNHRFSTAGSLTNGLLTVFWLALFLIGVS
ncbi:MAG: hypothetical protein ACOX8E_06175 [Ruminococcus sp.]|jgi:hypothetical protein